MKSYIHKWKLYQWSRHEFRVYTAPSTVCYLSRHSTDANLFIYLSLGSSDTCCHSTFHHTKRSVWIWLMCCIMPRPSLVHSVTLPTYLCTSHLSHRLPHHGTQVTPNVSPSVPAFLVLCLAHYPSVALCLTLTWPSHLDLDTDSLVGSPMMLMWSEDWTILCQQTPSTHSSKFLWHIKPCSALYLLRCPT